MTQKMMVTVHDDLYRAVKAQVHETGIPYAVVVRRALEYWVRTGLMPARDVDTTGSQKNNFPRFAGNSSDNAGSDSFTMPKSPRQMTAADIMHLPMEERRRLMASQADEMAAHYTATAVEREEWQGDDQVE